MKRKSNVVVMATRLCREAKKCTRIDLISKLSISLSTSYSLWDYLVNACTQGLLDDEYVKCVYDHVSNAITFEEKK